MLVGRSLEGVMALYKKPLEIRRGLLYYEGFSTV